MNVRTLCSALGAAVVIGLASLPAAADTGVSVGPEISSTGLGVSLGYDLPAGLVLRAESGNYTYNPNFNANGNTYNGHLNLSNVVVDAELHPLGKTFYVAAGGFINNNTINASTTSPNLTIGGTNYGSGTANARITWAGVNPYVGFGFAPRHGGFGFDLGAAFQGSAKAVVTTNIPTATAADIANAQSQIQNALSGFQVYPVIGLRYSFGF